MEKLAAATRDARGEGDNIVPGEGELGVLEERLLPRAHAKVVDDNVEVPLRAMCGRAA